MCVCLWAADERSLDEVLHIQYAHVQSLFKGMVQRHSSASKQSQPGCSTGSNVEVCRKDIHSILTY